MPRLADLMEARAGASAKMRGLLDQADAEKRDPGHSICAPVFEF